MKDLKLIGVIVLLFFGVFCVGSIPLHIARYQERLMCSTLGEKYQTEYSYSAFSDKCLILYNGEYVGAKTFKESKEAGEIFNQCLSRQNSPETCKRYDFGFSMESVENYRKRVEKYERTIEDRKKTVEYLQRLVDEKENTK